VSIPDLGLDFDRLKSELGSDLGDIFHTATAAARGGLERITRAAGGTQNTLARIPQAGGGGGNPLGRIANFGSYGGGGTGLEFFDTLGGSDPFASFNRAQAMFQPQQQEKTTAPTTPGAAGGQVSSSADNANLSAESVDAWIAKTRPNSPLVGKGGYILQAANARGVSVPQMLGIMLKETELGTTAGANKNLGGIVAPTDQGLGTNRQFNGYATWEQSIDAIANNLASDIYRGKSLAEQIGNWYVGPNEYARAGLAATDQAGNGTVQDYLNIVAQVYAGLGVPFNQNATPQYATSGAGIASMFGGKVPPIMQEFGSTAYSTGEGAGVYDFGTQFGLNGDEHSGLDIAVPRGTQFTMPAGLSGTVRIAGGSGFYKTNGGDAPGRGELRILLDNGYELILGHNDRIDVQVGQRVTAGQLLGLTGSSDGDHLHIEVRVPDRSTPSGWRIVDPRTLFGGGR